MIPIPKEPSTTPQTHQRNMINQFAQLMTLIDFFFFLQDIMNIRNLKILKLSNSEIPTDFGNNMGVLLYRDTMNFLQYLEQVFRKLYDMDS